MIKKQSMVMLAPSKLLGARTERGKMLLSLPFKITGKSKEPGVIVHTDGRVAQVVKIDPPGALSWSVERLKLLMDVLVQQVSDSGLDVQLVITSKDFPMESLVERTKPSTSIEYLSWFNDYLDKWLLRISELNDCETKEFYLVLSTPAQKRKKTTKITYASQQRRQLSLKCSEFCNSLGGGLVGNLESLDCEQIRCLVNNQLCSAPGEHRKRPPPPLAATKSTLSDYMIFEGKGEIYFGEKVVRNFYVSQLPSATLPMWLGDVLQMSELCTTMSIHVTRIDQTSVRRRLKSAGKDMNAPLALLASAVVAGTERAVELSIYASIPEIEGRTNGKDLAYALNNHGAVLKGANRNQLPVWLSCLPVGSNYAKAAHTVTVRSAVSCFSLSNPVRESFEGTLIGFGQPLHPVMLNLFENNEAKRLFILGGNSAESECLFNSLALRFSFFHNVLIVGSVARYRYLLETIGAALANSAVLGMPVCSAFWNPCETLAPSEVCELICRISVMSKMSDVSPEQRTQLQIAVEAMSANGAEYNLNSISRVLEAQESLAGLGNSLRCFLGSAPGYCFSSASSFDFAKRIMLLDFSRLHDSAIARYTALRSLIGAAKTKIRGKGRSVIMIEEASKWFDSAEDRALLGELVNTAASNGIALVLSSLDPYRCLSSGLNDQLINSSDFTAVLRPPNAHLRMSASKLGLNRSETQYLSLPDMHRGSTKMLLRRGRNDSIGISFKPSPMEIWLSGLTREEKVKRNEMMKYLRAKYPDLNHTDTCRQALWFLGQSLC